MALVLIGPPATGKTQVGRRVADYLGVAAIDTDVEIARQHGPISHIFAKHGEAYFRDREREEVVKALAQPTVVSLGGGAIMDTKTQADLASAHVVLLTMTREAAMERIGHGKRPLINGIESWDNIAAQRAHLYEALADYTVDTSRRPPAAIARDIIEWLKGQP